MKVELIACTQPIGVSEFSNPLSVVESCASVCYNSKPTKSFAIARSCERSGHMSVFEHISFTFKISGVSRVLLAQLTRHRHASFSVRSQRYCKEDGFEFYVPNSMQTDSLYAEMEKAVEAARESYAELVSNGVPQEDARYVLPNACYTELFMTVNARALVEMSNLRLCTRAQREIRTMFAIIKKEVEHVCPEVATYMVPSCEKHGLNLCQEGRSCGRHETLEEMKLRADDGK